MPSPLRQDRKITLANLPKETNEKRGFSKVSTLDFSTPYIQTKKNRAKESDRTLLLFCWDTDSYRLLKPNNVTSVVPLSSILRNGD